MKRKGLTIVIIICVAVFFITLISGALLAVRSIGWADLQNRTQLKEKIQNLISKFEWPAFIKGSRETFNIDELRTSDLSGISEIKISAVAEHVQVDTGGNQIEARISGSYISWGKEMSWKMDRHGEQLVIYAEYPHYGTLWSDLDIKVTIPAEYAGKVKVSTVSGDCLLAGEPDRSWTSFQFNGVSGSLSVERANFSEVSFITVSGDAVLKRCTGNVDGESISGDIQTAWDQFGGARLKTVSGNCKLVLPKDASAAINFTTVSGNFETNDLQISITSQQKRKLAATMNSGEHPLTVNTVSGDLHMSGS
jgi:hypothetical protein